MTLFDHTRVAEWEELTLADLFEAFETSRKRNLVDDDDKELILSGDGADLSAVCSAVRMCWARRMCGELSRHFGYDVRSRTINQSVFWFTLVDVTCARPSDEFDVDLRPIIRRLRKGLRDHNFIGVIEPGLYSHISLPGTNLGYSKCISWHLHAFVWGIDRQEAAYLAAESNRSRRHIPISPDQEGVAQEEIGRGEFPRTLAYLLKRPSAAYRIGLKEWVASGELKPKQYVTDARPGERLTLYLQLKHLSLADLWVAAGEGEPILKSVIRGYRRAVRRRERDAQDWAKARRRRRPEQYPKPLA